MDLEPCVHSSVLARSPKGLRMETKMKQQKYYDPRPGHRKYQGFVERVYGGNRWDARVSVEGTDYLAEDMDTPLPAGRKEGSRFTFHVTKRGDTYLWWIDSPPFSKRQFKKAFLWARMVEEKLSLS